MAPSVLAWLRCCRSPSSVSLRARGRRCSAAAGSRGCFASSSPRDVRLSYPTLTPASRCASFPLKDAAAPTPPIPAPTAGGPGGQPSFSLPKRKYVGDYFISGRVAPASGAGDEVPGMGVAGQREVSAGPRPPAATRQAGFGSQCHILQSLPRSATATVLLPAPADTGVPGDAGGWRGERRSVGVQGEVMPAYTRSCLLHHGLWWVAHQYNTRSLRKYDDSYLLLLTQR